MWHKYKYGVTPITPYHNHNHLSRRRSCLKVFIPLSPISFGWSHLNIWYYGSRYARKCHPDDLWTSYFTSSRHVKKFREEHGEPNIVQVRRTFQTKKETTIWESKVLRRLRVVKDKRWLNKTCQPGPMGGNRRITMFRRNS